MELISLVQEVVCWPLLTLTDRLIISFSCTLTLQKLKIKNTNKHHSKEENILQVSSRIDDQSHSKMSCTDQVCIPLGWSGSGLGIQDLSGSWCIKGTDESIVVVDLSVTLMHHVPDRSWITDPDPDHPKEMHLITHFTSIQWTFNLMLAHICLSDKSNFIFPWTQKIFIYSLCVINYPLQVPIIEGVDGKDPKWNLMNVRSPRMSLLQVKYCNMPSEELQES